MKKKTFFLSSLVAVALFIGAITLTSCNKEDVDYDSLNSDYVVNVYATKDAYHSHNCTWCDTPIPVGGHCIHYYPQGVCCGDEDCPHYTTMVKHRHIFSVFELGFSGYYHEGGAVGEDEHNHGMWD